MRIYAQTDGDGNIGIGVPGGGGMIAFITGNDFDQGNDGSPDEPCGAGMTSEEIALRLVACWNIYEGIPTEEIMQRLRLLEGI